MFAPDDDTLAGKKPGRIDAVPDLARSGGVILDKSLNRTIREIKLNDQCGL